MTTKKKFPSIDQNKLKVLCDILCDKITDLLDCLDVEYKENGKNDFICTNAVTYYIRDRYLHAAVQMRSNDVMFGYRNDYAWQRYVQVKLQQDLYYSGVHVELGHMYWQVQNLHVYERHFDLVK